jgi:hypothetical protein
MAPVDAIELETKVKDLYRHGPSSRTARTSSKRGVRWPNALGTRPTFSTGLRARDRVLRRVGYFVDLADLRPGERVMDLGSGSGMDTFVAGALARLRRSQDRPGEPHQRAGDLGGGAASPLALILVDLRRQRRQQHLDQGVATGGRLAGRGQQRVDVARQDPEAPVAKRRSPTSAPAPGGRAARAGRPLWRTRRPAARPAAPGPSGGGRGAAAAAGPAPASLGQAAASPS